jgi:hypothetical protein
VVLSQYASRRKLMTPETSSANKATDGTPGSNASSPRYNKIFSELQRLATLREELRKNEWATSISAEDGTMNSLAQLSLSNKGEQP